MQGGIHPSFTGDFYVELLRAIKAELPGLHVHAYSPLEVHQGAETAHRSLAEQLSLLREAGLGTLPGTAAEILDDRIRKYLCPDKIRTQQWRRWSRRRTGRACARPARSCSAPWRAP